jgi:hypothetical protein
MGKKSIFGHRCLKCRRLAMAIAEGDATHPSTTANASPARSTFDVPSSSCKKKLTPKRRKH